MKKIRITSGKFKGQEFEIEGYLYLDEEGKLWNNNTHLGEALPGDSIMYEKREPVTIEGTKGIFISHPVEIVQEPTNFQIVLSRDMWRENKHVFPADDLYSSKVMYHRDNTAEYV